MSNGGSTSTSSVAPWPLLASELVGTAILVSVGLSIVIFDFGHSSPMLRWLPSAAVRRALTGFLFGSVGATIAISPVGRMSGAHINPVVSLSFRIRGKMSNRLTLGYVLAQLTGAILGALPLLAWGTTGSSIGFGATTPSTGGPILALLGETVTTFALVLGLFTVLGSPRTRRFTPLLFPPLYAVMVWLEAPLSGTSTNPARSLGPAVVSGDWHGFWIYIAGPLLGALIALAVLRVRPLRHLEVDVAKIYHFTHDRYGVLGRN